MATFSSADAAGCNARKIRPRHGVMESMPNWRQIGCLTRSAETASRAGSSRTSPALVAASGGRTGGEAGFALMTMNWPETLLRVAVGSSSGDLGAGDGGEKNAANKKTGNSVQSPNLESKTDATRTMQRFTGRFIFCPLWIRPSPARVSLRLSARFAFTAGGAGAAESFLAACL